MHIGSICPGKAGSAVMISISTYLLDSDQCSHVNGNKNVHQSKQTKEKQGRSNMYNGNTELIKNDQCDFTITENG